MEVTTEAKANLFTHYVYTSKITTRIPFLSQWLKRRRMLKAYELGFKNIKQERGLPHLIHLNVVLPAGIGVLHLHKKHSIPFVVNEGWTGYMKEDGSYKGFLVKYFTQKIIKAAACILPVSKDLQEAMMRHGLKGKYKVLPNVIQTEIFKPFSGAAHNGTEGPTFIHISTFDPRQKNTLGILRAFKKALEKTPELNLVLVGGEEHKSELRDYVNQNALESKVHFKGKSNAEELAALFNQSKALIMFSNYESFGVVIGEALACGLPVICSQAGGLANTLGPELGLKVQTKNEEQLCTAILNMAGDKVVYNKTTLRNFVTERFSEAVIAEELKTLYQEILSHK
jgi:L-malate glycosyltransferase